MQRKGSYSISRILNLVAQSKSCLGSRLIDDVVVRVDTKLLKLFLYGGTACAVCGIKAKHFVIERKDYASPWALSLYAIKNGKEVVMTKDHVIPKSRGGKDNHSNLQVMCIDCNQQKGVSGLVETQAFHGWQWCVEAVFQNGRTQGVSHNMLICAIDKLEKDLASSSRRPICFVSSMRRVLVFQRHTFILDKRLYAHTSVLEDMRSHISFSQNLAKFDEWRMKVPRGSGIVSAGNPFPIDTLSSSDR